MTDRRIILLIGGTGVFGTRLAQHLAMFDGVEIIITSRKAARAQAVANAIRLRSPAARITGQALERYDNLAASLAAIAPFLVIDASGPFQKMDYRVARAALEAGAHFLDLADASDYVLGFAAALDDLAKRQDRVALCGASSTPGLSGAVVRSLTRGWQRVDTIDIAITPGGKSEVGEAVIEAVLSYAGLPVPVVREGQLQTASGWGEARQVFMPRLGRRRVALVETADAALLGHLHKVGGHVRFYAGLEVGIEKRGLEALGFLRRRGILRNPSCLTAVLKRLRRVSRLIATARGGMLVRVIGLGADGTWQQAEWSLLAENDDGPQVPTLPVAAAARVLLAGAFTAGARPSSESLTLERIADEMAPYSLSTLVTVKPLTCALFQGALGDPAFLGLPAPLRQFHGAAGQPVWRGRAQVEGAKSLVGRWIAAMIGFPGTQPDTDVTVSVERGFSLDGDAASPPVERWVRNFGARRFASTLRATGNGLVEESFGSLTVVLRVEADDAGLRLPVVGWRIGKVGLPRFLAPRSEASESLDAAGRFAFDVALFLPLVGLLARYRGFLEPS